MGAHGNAGLKGAATGGRGKPSTRKGCDVNDPNNDPKAEVGQPSAVGGFGLQLTFSDDERLPPETRAALEQQLLTKSGILDRPSAMTEGVHFAHVRSFQGARGTVCLIRYAGIESSGFALCCPLDTFSKPKGRGIAYRRAIKKLVDEASLCTGDLDRASSLYGAAAFAGRCIKKSRTKLA
jgi:hypothetical protein